MSQRAYSTLFGQLLVDFDSIGSNIRVAMEACEQGIGVAKLVEAFKQLVDAHALNSLKKGVVETMKTRLLAGRELEDLNDTEAFLVRFGELDDSDPLANLPRFSDFFNTEFQKELEKYMALSEEDKYERNKDYFEMRKSLWAVNHSEPFSFDGSTAMDEDVDLQVTGEIKNFKCPITAMHMTEIYTSTLCKHSYSPVIKQYIMRNNGKFECPVAGCNKYVRLEILERDPRMERVARKYENARVEQEEEQRATQETVEVV
ncbi:hypothetical protein BC830DRAFT_1232302 [Chytriomyces sp. MP71]|nr:hypothetical protein BC830DRAFT_1232302 [Chytriomyces sp. MP71]